MDTRKDSFGGSIALIGFMGVGKSTVAEGLKELLGMDVVDMDEEIEAREGMVISRIFQERGEEYFRRRETELTAELSHRRGTVISCGGGCVLRAENVENLKKGGAIVLLTASPGTVLERVKDSDHRPLLRGNMNEAFIAGMMEKRREAYGRAADLVVDTDGKTVREICEEIIAGTKGTPRAVMFGGVEVGRGMPKVVVPVVGATRQEAEEQAREVLAAAPDLVEWRADFCEGGGDPRQAVEILSSLREILGEIPILFTFRTRSEGGEGDISPAAYRELNRWVAGNGQADGIDVECFSGTQEDIRTLIDHIRAAGKVVVGSNHDFHRTPPKGEMVERLRKMEELGAHVAKLAVMPRNPADVLELLSATEEMTRLYARGPVVTVSMSGTGTVSRLCGEVFGSAMTFGAVGRTSAPGQIPVKELRALLTGIHNAM